MSELMENIPPGKEVEVIYLRDGEQKITKLAPIAENDFERLKREFNERAGGHGRFGFDDDDTERVPIPGTKMFGVKLGRHLAEFPG